MKRFFSLLCLCLFWPLAGGAGFAADLSVQPVRVFFAPGQNSSMVSITNNDPKSTVTLQVTVFAWAQNKEGQHVYTPTEELVVFPRIFKLAPKSEQIIRIGATLCATTTEKSYRIYIEELPIPTATGSAGAVIKTFLKLGVPVFLEPAKSSAAGAVRDLAVRRGTLSFSLANLGTIHFNVNEIVVRGIDATGGEVFQATSSGSYVLARAAVPLHFKLSKDNCARIRSLVITIATDSFSLHEETGLSPAMCSNL